jgi:phosphate transport system substrate-binding protein
MFGFMKYCAPVTMLAAIALAGCSGANEGAVKITGSDTMVGLAQAWAEEFRVNHPDISPQIKGGGSGTGIAALCSGKIQIATASRPMKPKEIELAKSNTGKEPKEYIVGRDALAVYVHKDNPLETITLEDLGEIYGEGGKITRWKDMGVENPGCVDGEIIRVSRQNSSGTYAYFREHVLGEGREYKQGATAQSGSSDVVALVSKTPCAIGYSGMGYGSGEVKVLQVAKEKGGEGVAPTPATALDGSYPIARPLYLYTLGEPTGAVREFVDWILSDAGQAIVEREGYVPVAKKAGASDVTQSAAQGRALAEARQAPKVSR